MLNQYVDQQIDPADAVLLEQEISRNPGRRETYREYCRMQRACGMLFEQSLPQASVGEKLAAAAAAADRKVIEFPVEATRNRTAIFGAGLGLAAACVAVAFVLLRNPAPTAPEPVAAIPTPTVEQAVEIAPRVAAATPSTDAEFRPSLFLRQRERTEGEIVLGNPIPESLKWIAQVELTPLVPANAASLSFERPLPAAPKVFRSDTSLSPDQAIELNAIRFPLDK